MKGKTKAIITVFVVILAGIYYYAAIPAINIHSSETWFFIMIFLVILAVLYLGRKKLNRYEVRESKVVKGFLGVIVFLGVVYLLGTLFSSPVINAKKYQKLMTVKEGEFTKDVDELSFDKIPLLDKDTAALLGDRKMGSMVDMVSQFEADDIYSQINYKRVLARSFWLMANPLFSSPIRFVAGILTSWKITSVVLEVRIPNLSSSFPTLTPGVLRSTMKREIPALPSSGEVDAATV